MGVFGVLQQCPSLPIGIGAIGIDEQSFESIRRFERVDDRRIVRIGHAFEAMVLDDGQVIAFKGSVGPFLQETLDASATRRLGRWR